MADIARRSDPQCALHVPNVREIAITIDATDASTVSKSDSTGELDQHAAALSNVGRRKPRDASTRDRLPGLFALRNSTIAFTRREEAASVMHRLRQEQRKAIDPQAPREIATVRIDRGGRILTASASAGAMLGYTPERLTGRALVELAALGARAPVLAAVRRLAFGTGEVFDLQLEGRSGRRTPIRLAVRQLVQASSGDTEFVTEWEERVTTSGRDPVACENGPESKRFAYELLNGQEAERRRVTSDLHGGVTPAIHLAKLTLERAMQQFVHGSAGEGLDAINEASLQLKDVLTELGKISSELRPSLLDDLGLIPTIDWFCRQFEDTNRKPRVERAIDVREQQVPDHLKLEVFRIFQEALSNVASHAEATRAQVTLTIADDELLATVEDDGVGFDADEIFYGNECLLGIGLLSIKKRICATGGRMLLDAVAGSGTLIGAAWKVG